jgi:hypothetical protein
MLTPPIVLLAVFELYFIFKLLSTFSKRRRLRLGYEGELAVGQELIQLMRDGYFVFHDFPTDKFNIDHIIVGPAGVFAVETKARQKPMTGNGCADAKVVYDGKTLHFPNWTDNKSLGQARRQARWLSEWLTYAVGDKVPVQPILALPGWFIERTSPNGMKVINPKNFSWVLKSDKNKTIDENMINRIVHQLDHRCRDVHSRSCEGLGGRPGLSDGTLT